MCILQHHCLVRGLMQELSICLCVPKPSISDSEVWNASQDLQRYCFNIAWCTCIYIYIQHSMYTNKKVKISFSDFVTHLLCYMLTLAEVWLLLRGFFSIAGIPSVQSNVQVTLSVVTWHKILWCNVLLYINYWNRVMKAVELRCMMCQIKSDNYSKHLVLFLCFWQCHFCGCT